MNWSESNFLSNSTLKPSNLFLHIGFQTSYRRDCLKRIPINSTQSFYVGSFLRCLFWATCSTFDTVSYCFTTERSSQKKIETDFVLCSKVLSLIIKKFIQYFPYPNLLYLAFDRYRVAYKLLLKELRIECRRCTQAWAQIPRIS